MKLLVDDATGALPAIEEEEITESDKLLFNPCEDELNQQWVFDTLLKQSQINQQTCLDYQKYPVVNDNKASAESSVSAQINRALSQEH